MIICDKGHQVIVFDHRFDGDKYPLCHAINNSLAANAVIEKLEAKVYSFSTSIELLRVRFLATS